MITPSGFAPTIDVLSAARVTVATVHDVANVAVVRVSPDTK